MTISNIIAAVVGIICLVILAFIVLGAGATVPLWVWPALIGSLAVALIVHPR